MTVEGRRLYSRWAATLALAFAGGWVAQRIGAPLPWLLGAMAATGVAAARGVRFFNGPPSFPPRLRLALTPVIGVLIGAAFHPETVAQIPGWWLSLVSILLFVPAAHAANYLILRRALGFEPGVAYFAGMPGGLIESIEMATENGADVRPVALLQFARVSIVVSAIPILYSLVEGHAVGSAAGMSFSRGGTMSPWDALLLFGAGVLGFAGGRALRLPAGQVTGPLILSALLHGMGWTEAAPPAALVAFAQLGIGAHLGCRFAGAEPSLLRRCLGASALTVAAMIAIGAAFGLIMQIAGVAPVAVMALCYAPGGLVEMGLIALSLNANPIFVTAHHIVRIMMTVSVAAFAWRRIGPGAACQQDRPGE